MHKDFISRLQWTARARKNSFSSLSCSDKTTNAKFNGNTLKLRELYAEVRLSFKISEKFSVCKKNKCKNIDGARFLACSILVK